MRTRILLVSAFPPSVGGISRWAEGILESDLAREFEIHTIDTSPPDIESGGDKSRFSLRRVWASLAMLFRMAAKLRTERPQVVQINTSYYWAFLRDGLMVWLASVSGACTVLHLHGGDFELFVHSCRSPLRWFVMRTLRRTDCVIAITSRTKELLCEWIGPANVCYLPNFVRPEQFSRRIRDIDPCKSDEKPRPVEVLFSGWIIEAKGIIELLEAAHAIPELRLTLAGPIESNFLSRIDGLLESLGSRVALLGSLPHAEIIDLYERSDVFVLPTHREGFPNVILEAMAAGLPVISTPVGAIAEIVREGIDGFMVPVGDVAALADRLRLLIGDPKRRIDMGESGRRRVREQFAIERVVDQLAGLYRGLAGDREEAQ